MTVRLIPYGASRGARLLARGLNIVKGGTIRRGDIIINWGNGYGFNGAHKVFNADTIVAINKLRFYQACKEGGFERIPDFTTSRRQAELWTKKGPILARTLLSASQGAGIIVVEKGGQVPDARMYVKYHPKKHEYRVHVIDGKVVDVQQKRLRHGTVDPNYRVRNHRFGWIFSRQDVRAPAVVTNAALEVMQVIGLDFGAVDVGYNLSKDEACVYEVNTAPGLEGTTLKIYTTKIKRMIAKYVQTQNGERRA